MRPRGRTSAGHRTPRAMVRAMVRVMVQVMVRVMVLALGLTASAAASAAAAGTPASATTTKSPSGGATVVSDGPVAVSATLSPDPSFIGDLLRLELVAAFPKGVSVNLPIGLTLDPIHLVDVEEGAPETTGEGLRKKFILQVQCFELGDQKVPGFPLTWVDAEGAVNTLDIPPITFRVDSLLANEADPDPPRRDDDPPISREYPNTTAEIVIYSVFATLVGALLLAIVLRRYLGRVKPVYVPPPIPPHVVALEALDELERGALVEEGQYQTYYLQLTEIAKGYIEGRFGVMALDRTTEEITREVQLTPERIEPLSADEVVAFLQRCDLVKFARFAPPRDEAEGELAGVRALVVRSKPVEEDAKGDKAAADPGQGSPDAEAEEGEADAEPPGEADAAAPSEAPETAGPETAGREIAGPASAGPETAGPETAGPETAESKAAERASAEQEITQVESGAGDEEARRDD